MNHYLQSKAGAGSKVIAFSLTVYYVSKGNLQTYLTPEKLPLSSLWDVRQMFYSIV